MLEHSKRDPKFIMNEFIKQYIPIADMIAKTIGPQCEVVLHDLQIPQNSVVYIANDTITGRKIGDGFNLIISKVLLSRRFENDMVTNYSFRTDSGKQIKSSTVMIRDFNNKVVGAMCLNIDTTKVIEQIAWLQSLLPDPELRPQPSCPDAESYHVIEIVDDIIDRIFAGKDVKRMLRDEKLEIIRFMDSRGIFLTKGAIDKVSEKMGVSKVTIYSYLDELKNGNS